MNNKKIANIVFYKFFENDNLIQQACIFYEDGSVANVSYDDGLDAAERLVKQENISSKDLLRAVINDKKIHVLSGKELEERFHEFVVEKTLPQSNDIYSDSSKQKQAGNSNNDKSNDIFSDSKHQTSSPKRNTSTSGTKNGTDNTVPDNNNVSHSTVNSATKSTGGKATKGKKGFFKRIAEKIKNNKLVKRIALCVTALAIGLGAYSCAARNTKAGQMTNSNISSASTDNNRTADDIYASTPVNSAYDYHTYAGLLQTTHNLSQKRIMQQMGENLDYFNGTFAEKYANDKTKVKAALSWDEIVALNLAYNDHEKFAIEAMFNGSQIDQTKLSNAYKTATLQLTGAYVIGTRKNPVNSYKMIQSEEGQEFVKKYEDMLLDCKETTSDSDKIKKVNKFYTELYKDFPIDSKIREEGIAHADSRNTLESYKLAVTPIVAASEMMFQNLDIDHTLSDKAVSYFNDLGLCNIADAKFEKAMNITLNAEMNELIPTYEQFKKAKIKELTAADRYVTDDSSRDLSQLEEFKKIVNAHFDIVEGNFTGTISANTSSKTSTYSSTSYNTKTEKISTSDRNEAVSKSSESAVSAAERRVNSSIESENVQAKSQAEKEAEDIRKTEQAKADQNAESIKNKITQSEKDLQDKIDKANDKINTNNSDNNKNNDSSVNEKDFGDHGVNFDSNHSDESGNLNDSVKDITTDSSNDQTDQELPDPNQSGAIFDSQAENTNYQSNDQNIIEYEVPASYSMTNEEIVDAYIASLEDQSSNESQYVYRK